MKNFTPGTGAQANSTGLVVRCQLTDCFYHHSDPAAVEGFCRCAHPDKAHYRSEERCPLYRMDWQRRLKGR